MEILHTVAQWFLLFMFYSFVGWIIEVCVTVFEHRKVINRGFLIGPICPIYGTGAIIISLLLSQNENPVAIFCVAFVGGALLEYSVSYLMEKLFHVRWWDYTNRPFNLEGRICLQSVTAFGFAGLLIVKVITPLMFHLLSFLSTWFIFFIAGLLLFWLVFDVLLSLWLIVGVRVTVGTVQRDATEEISTRVRETLMDKGKLNRRLVKAFPNQAPSKKHPKAKKSKKDSSSSSSKSK